MKFKTKRKEIPIVEVKLKLTQDDIKAINDMGLTLTTTDYYGRPLYDCSIDVSNYEQAEIIKEVIEIIDKLNDD